MEVEEKIAQDIMKAVTRLGLPLRLDKITEGRGNCFPLALIAQCKRKDGDPTEREDYLASVAHWLRSYI